MKHVIIIGNGITGITVARNLRKLSDYKITVISPETDYFFSRTALMYIFMGHMSLEQTQPYENWFWEKNRVNLLKGRVDSIHTETKSLNLEGGGKIQYDTLVIAVGSKSNKFGWPGQDLQGVQGFYNYQDLKLMEKNISGTQRAVIVGGGLIGIEMAEMLMSRGIQVIFLVREKNFWDLVLPTEEARLIERHIKKHHVDLRLSTELKEIKDDGMGRVKSIVTNTGEEIDCGFVGLTVGVSPNVGFVKPSNIETDRGVLVNSFFETNAPDVYAAGDCAQFREPLPGRRPIEQVWYTGKMHGETLAHTICGQRKAYTPGIWLNSAKFFDIEYQTFGFVPSQLPEDQSTLYWEHPQCGICLRINYSCQDMSVIAFNAFGLRLRHEVCENWIRQKTSLEQVLTNLPAANFDPEFFRRYEDDIIAAYNKNNPEKLIQLKKNKKGLFKK